MSFEFGLKNVFRKSRQSRSYIITITILVAITVFFIYLGNGLGLVFFGAIPQFNVTTTELFSKYFQFIIISSMVIAIVWILVVNHSLIQHKTHDIAIMKAVGAIQKKLRSYFFGVVLVIDIIGIILGIIAGFLLYVIFFFILSIFGFQIVFFVDFVFIPILLVGIIITVFFINGYELWKTSSKKYAQIALGDIPQKTDTQFLNFLPRKPLGLRIKLAVRNLTRKRKAFYRVLLTTAITLSIIVTLTTSAFIISNTSIQSIQGAQGGDTLIIGHRDIVDHYIQRYEEFSDSSLEFSNNENLTRSEYLMNGTEIDSIFNTSSVSGVTFWDKRLLVYEFAMELKGYKYTIVEGVADYQIIGSNRTAYVPVMGLEFKNYTSQWQVIGALESTNNTALVGDTLGSQLFESATDQRVRLVNVTTSEYNITGVFYDSFCAGYATYVHLEDLQHDFNLTQEINLAIVGVDSTANKAQIIDELQSTVQSMLGNDFVVRDLTPIFEQNIKALFPFVIISCLVILVETIVIIASLYFYQTGNFQERTPDYAIIKGVGGSSKFIKKVIFYEDLAIIGISSGLSLGCTLIFNGGLLYKDAILPSIWFVLLLWSVITVIIIGMVRISVIFLYKELARHQQKILKDFSRAK